MLKNHYQMFQIHDKDKVRLKLWTNDNQDEKVMEQKKDSKSCMNKSNCIKTKSCLFYLYHPNGCLLSDFTCTYIHKK